MERIEKWLARGMFEAVNINSCLVHQEWTLPAGSITVHSVPNADGSIGHYSSRIPFAQARVAPYLPTTQGAAFGPTWSTHWFRVHFAIPPTMEGECVSLLWDPEAEALIWSEDGVPLQGITGGINGDRHVDFPLAQGQSVAAGEAFTFYIEVGCNGMFGAGAGWNGSILPPENDRTYTLKTAALHVPNARAVQLKLDVEVLLGIVKEQPADSQEAADALYCANAICNTFRHDVPASLEAACALTEAYFAARTRTESFPHAITAIGNCHIDTAWLWPYEETMRKCARSWATQCGLIEAYPHYTFAASQAQQFAWVGGSVSLFCMCWVVYDRGSFC